MTSHSLRIVEADDGCHLHLDSLPPHVREVVQAALDPMAKAAEPSEFPDPRWPQLAELVDDATLLWTRWSEALVEELMVALLERDVAEAVTRTLRVHAAGFLAEFAGVVYDPEALPLRPKLAKAKRSWPDVDEDHAVTALVPLATQLGMGADPTQMRAVGARTAPRRPLTESDREAMRYAAARAAAYMTKPVARLHADILADFARRGIPITRALSAEELQAVRAAVVRAIEEGRGVQQLAADLREAAIGTAMLNDMQRVARTELQTALCQGTAAELKRMYGGGGGDIIVFRVAGEGSCVHCKRLFGTTPNFVRYKLADLEAWDAAGGNFGKPASEWRAGIGPVHPNCACSGVLVDTTATRDANAPPPVVPVEPTSGKPRRVPRLRSMEEFLEVGRAEDRAARARSGAGWKKPGEE